jgi:ubiquinone/menaquinone biosynthesis C-methylase UbiE
MEGVVERLTSGASVIDIGCGSGLAIIELAKAFPKSLFVGYEASDQVLQRAEANLSDAGVSNVRFVDVRVTPPQPNHTADLVLSFDALHDMLHPDGVARLVHGLLKPDGVWFVLEIPCEATFEENLAKNRLNVAVTYATSLVACLPSSLSEPGGAGLGTCGLPEPAMRELALAAGFTRFRRLPEPSPHALFEVRP